MVLATLAILIGLFLPPLRPLPLLLLLLPLLHPLLLMLFVLGLLLLLLLLLLLWLLLLILFFVVSINLDCFIFPILLCPFPPFFSYFSSLIQRFFPRSLFSRVFPVFQQFSMGIVIFTCTNDFGSSKFCLITFSDSGAVS